MGFAVYILTVPCHWITSIYAFQSINQSINQTIHKTSTAPISSANRAQRCANTYRDHVS